MKKIISLKQFFLSTSTPAFKKIYFYLIFVIIFSACPIGDPVSYADYYVSNETNNLIYLEVHCSFCGINSDPELLENEVQPSKKAHIYTFIEGSGGHVMPSNAFSDFIAYQIENDSISIVYRGVKNEDWIPEGVSKDKHQIYTLVVN